MWYGKGAGTVFGLKNAKVSVYVNVSQNTFIMINNGQYYEYAVLWKYL